MKKTVLVVDDEPLNIRILAELLADNFRVVVAKSGEQALKRATMEPRPDAILLDIMMPEMSGFEVCEVLKGDSATQDIPVIFVSAMSQPEDKAKALEYGGYGYVLKPITPADLFATLNGALGLT